MNFPFKKILIASMTLFLLFVAVGCDLSSTTAPATTVTTTQATSLTTSATTATTTVTTTVTTTAETTMPTTSIYNVGLVLSGDYKTVYEVGESFDSAGLIVTLVKSDASETVVTGYAIYDFTTVAAGIRFVRIRYQGVEASYAILVQNPIPAFDIALELVLPTRLIYDLGDPADWTGLIVSVVQSDGERIVVPESTYSVSGFDSDTPGVKTITVTYDDMPASFPIYIAEPAAVGGLEMIFVAPTKTAYSIGETLALAGMQVSIVVTGQTPIVLTSTQYSVSSPDMATAGTKVVYVSTLGMQASFSITVTDPSTPIDLMAYYDAAEGLTGSALLQALRDIVTAGFVGVAYTSVSYILDETDADTAHAGYLIEFYTGTSTNATWDSGVTWNKEHVWPQSLLGCTASGINTCSDIQNLKPSNPSINSSRGNKWFSTVTNTVSYFPTRTAIHGDIARILFYMMVRYSYLSLVELGVSESPSVYQMGDLSTLLAWHLADPVDDFERNRNEIIEDYQHNRNPFIDYPEFVEMIWG